MPMKIYNTLTKKKEEFIPLEKPIVKMYICGPTVYDEAHLGHGRTYVAFDLIRRYLEHRNYIVRLVMNFTDIDDKIIDRSKREGVPIEGLTNKYIRSFLKDMEKLKVKGADIYPRVSEHIDDIIEFIDILIKKGYAYVSKGGVYFHVKKFKDYGKLSNVKLDEEKIHRVEDPNKRDPADFALWKFAKPGEPSWDSPWGKGRPAWHIECSAMAIKYLGECFDIHGGGSDLIFPHHENEIAQSEAYTGKSPWVKYWIHTGFVTVDDEKMSKSLGNFVTLKEILRRYDPEVVRFFLLQRHYRSPLEYSEEGLKDTMNTLERLYNTLENIDAVLRDSEIKYKLEREDRETLNTLTDLWMKFYSAMDDDFNTPEALKYVFEVSSCINRYMTASNRPNRSTLLLARDFFKIVGEIFGIFDKYYGSSQSEDEEFKHLVDILIDIRNKLRKEKNFPLADEIRDKLKKIGIQLEDTPKGTLWKRVV
ncbi:cysteine--tRNA ligase [Methanofervidicoccus sp. A16]|uniref:cysteine--tRNA ligase n=1 Tax=Methanofervidicoccus sp. A16 TaxID=2607662 RepID=UPI001187D880|nr:cysteine--tRNA ligase [Methanofervidicoccus sp. A16]